MGKNLAWYKDRFCWVRGHIRYLAGYIVTYSNKDSTPVGFETCSLRPITSTSPRSVNIRWKVGFDKGYDIVRGAGGREISPFTSYTIDICTLSHLYRWDLIVFWTFWIRGTLLTNLMVRSVSPRALRSFSSALRNWRDLASLEVRSQESFTVANFGSFV